MTAGEIRQTVRSIVADQRFGVLATSGKSGPHSTIVSFAAADNLTTIVFATPTDTRKFENLRQSTRVSFFIDDRLQHQDRLLDIHGIEARGTAGLIDPEDRAIYEQIFLARHPELTTFLNQSALVRIDVDTYDMVHSFQNVLVFNPGEKG